MSGDGRLTMAVERAFFERLAEASALGADCDLLRAVADALKSGDPLADDFAGRMMALEQDNLPRHEWASFLIAVLSLVDRYVQLKRYHGPQRFRALLNIILELECFQPLLDNAERAALGLKGGERDA